MELELNPGRQAPKGWRGWLAKARTPRYAGSGLFLAGFVCGLIVMKVIGGGATRPAHASAAPAAADTSADDSASTGAAPRDPKSKKSPTALRAAPTDATSDDDMQLKASVLSILHNLRSQIELYKLQHADRVPEMSRHPAWAQLTRKTRPDGTPAPDGPFGPYIEAAPTNPLNGFSTVGVMKKLPAPGSVVRAEKLGFVYASTTGEIAATDADGKTIFDEQAARTGDRPGERPAERKPANPAKPSAAARTAQPTPAENKHRSLLSVLMTLRSQLDQYRQQHDDRYPDFNKYTAWEQFTRKTARDGMILTGPAKESFGPYLMQAPTNPLNGLTAVEVVAKLTAYKPAARKVGYVFETATGKLYATDAAGGIVKE